MSRFNLDRRTFGGYRSRFCHCYGLRRQIIVRHNGEGVSRNAIAHEGQSQRRREYFHHFEYIEYARKSTEEWTDEEQVVESWKHFGVKLLVDWSFLSSSFVTKEDATFFMYVELRIDLVNLLSGQIQQISNPE